MTWQICEVIILVLPRPVPSNFLLGYKWEWIYINETDLKLDGTDLKLDENENEFI